MEGVLGDLLSFEVYYFVFLGGLGWVYGFICLFEGLILRIWRKFFSMKVINLCFFKVVCRMYLESIF